MTSYNGHNESVPLDVAGVDGVFSGWTASDIVGPPKDIAQLIYAIYGPESPLLPPELQNVMVPNVRCFLRCAILLLPCLVGWLVGWLVGYVGCCGPVVV